MLQLTPLIMYIELAVLRGKQYSVFSMFDELSFICTTVVLVIHLNLYCYLFPFFFFISAGKAGHALLFLLPSEKSFLEVLELRGVKGISALSLSATLNGAAAICRELTAEGVKRSGGGYGSGAGSRNGEAFATAIQNRLEECIVEDEAAYKDQLRTSLEQKKTKGANKILKNSMGPLHEASVKAYSAYIRSYPAKEKAVRHIFSPRALHLGHVGKEA